MKIELEKYLKDYDETKYNHPSVTTDTLIFTKNNKNELCVLLFKRTDMPFKDWWSIPGGFVDIDESLEDNVKRKLKEKLGLDNIKVEQLYTFGNVDRDPRTRVISVAYFALVPEDLIKVNQSVKFFRVSDIEDLKLAFDHKDIINVAVERIRGKISYTNLAFDLIKDKTNFTINELQKIYESVLGKKLDTPNFRRMFVNRFVKEGFVELNEVSNKTFEIIRTQREISHYLIALNYINHVKKKMISNLWNIILQSKKLNNY